MNRAATLGSQVLGYVRRNHLALVALFIALGGTSYAALTLPRNSVGAAEIKRAAVRSAEVRDRSLLRRDFRAGQIPVGPQAPPARRDPRAARTGRPVGVRPEPVGVGPERLLFLNGTLRSTGALRLGSETGTTQGPNYPTGSNDLVIRRIYSIDQDDGVLARVGPATFGRASGSEVSFSVDNSNGTQLLDVDCFGVRENGNELFVKTEVAAGGTALILPGGVAADAFTCSFMIDLGGVDQWAQTQVTLQRSGGGGVWIGTLISTDNQ